MNDFLTKADIDNAVSKLIRNCVEPNVIKTVKEARLATKHDIFGTHWKKGDRYYHVYILNRSVTKRIRKILMSIE